MRTLNNLSLTNKCFIAFFTIFATFVSFICLVDSGEGFVVYIGLTLWISLLVSWIVLTIALLTSVVR